MIKTFELPGEQAEYYATASGIGNWEAFNGSPDAIHDVLREARHWAQVTAGHDKLWLCWNVDPAWCLIQQALVQQIGWTPLVGFDPRVGPPPLLPGALSIDFNAPFGFRTMYPHFPLEFAFAFVPGKLAFWHSDLLVPVPQLTRYAQSFEDMPDGQIIATKEDVSLTDRLRGKKLTRAWELLGCVSRAGSEHAFMSGCGWWMCFYLHPMLRGHDERRRRVQQYWDHGTGILYWHEHCKGPLQLIANREIDAGHFTRIGRRDTYKVHGHDDWRRNLAMELSANFELEKACESMGLSELWRSVKARLAESDVKLANAASSV
ncbi:MAG: hypothetical protein V3V71_08400 [Roseateles sp.]